MDRDEMKRRLEDAQTTIEGMTMEQRVEWANAGVLDRRLLNWPFRMDQAAWDKTVVTPAGDADRITGEIERATDGKLHLRILESKLVPSGTVYVIDDATAEKIEQAFTTADYSFVGFQPEPDEIEAGNKRWMLEMGVRLAFDFSQARPITITNLSS